MTTQPAPTAPSSRARLVLRVLGALLLLGGLALVVVGGLGIADEVGSSDMDGGFGPILTLAAGGFMVVVGLGCLNAGFLGAQARYAATETAPAVRTTGQAWRGDGTTVTCPQCGAGTRSGARFCDACGHGLG